MNFEQSFYFGAGAGVMGLLVFVSQSIKNAIEDYKIKKKGATA